MSYTKKRSNSILNIPKFPWGGLDNLNAFSLFGSIASPLLGIGGAMLNKAMANSNMMANDYYTYQNEMENSKGSINRGGLTSILKYGGRIMRFPDGGEMPEDQGPKLIQAEKGETIIDGMGNIFDVKANKLHKDMSKNDVTDVLTPNQYVLSNRFELSKKDADKIPIGISPITYDESEWSKFDNFTIQCVQYYLKNGLQKQHHKNLELRKFITETSNEFYEWVQDGNLPKSQRLYNTKVLRQFMEEYPDFSQLHIKTFKKWIKLYCDFNGFLYSYGNDPNDGGRYFYISSKNEEKVIIDDCPF